MAFELIHSQNIDTLSSSVVLSNNLNGGVVADINGDRDEQYWCRWWWVQDSSPTSRRWKVRPNGVTTETYGLLTSVQASQDIPIGEVEMFFAGTDKEFTSGQFWLNTLADPGGGVTFPRTLWGDAVVWNDPAILSTTFRQYVNAAWDPAVATTNITSLTFGTTAAASTTLVSAIGVGSRIELYRLRRS